MDHADRLSAVKFAVAYSSYNQACAEMHAESRIVWQDLLVQAADALGIKDQELSCLADCRAEVAARDRLFLQDYARRNLSQLVTA